NTRISSDAAVPPASAAGSMEREATSDTKPRTAEEQKNLDIALAAPFFVTINLFVQGQPDAAKVVEALKGRSEGEIEAIKELYRKTNNGRELEDDLRDKFPGNREIFKAFYKLGTPAEKRVNEEKVSDTTAKLVVLMGGMGTDKAVTSLLQSCSEGELRAVKVRFEQLRGKELDEFLTMEYDGLDLK